MKGLQQLRLVAAREIRVRGRSKGFLVGLVVMVVVVVAAIVAPTVLERSGRVTRDVGFTGTTPATLARSVTDQGEAVDVAVRVHRYDDVTTGEAAVRDGDVDVLVVDAQRLEWRREPDERLRLVVTGAIQLVEVQARARAAGIDPAALLALVAPVPVENVELGLVAGSSPDNEAAAFVMSVLLLLAVVTYGNLVLTGVAEEKASRVVEVLLARMPARTLLAGKVAGIGLLGLGQLLVTVLAAIVATALVDPVDLPAIDAGPLAWVVVWFVLGYAMYATVYGAVGSLASRSEDAASAAGPVSYVLLAAYWASYAALAGNPDGSWARVASYLPPTAPFAMPGRIALDATSWWEPPFAVALTLAAIGALTVLAGRVYTGAILHMGPTLRLRQAWRTGTAGSGAETPPRDGSANGDEPTRGRQVGVKRTGRAVGPRSTVPAMRTGAAAPSAPLGPSSARRRSGRRSTIMRRHVASSARARWAPRQ
jgi:ABC-2 type transport system permease protein